eukprot:TRINITY_DN48150_c0_g1_i1.p1 TRINITY_DN48150_c0_g1~~TRINITY_DN48150_c0_g1_i1.p1  ORF type:complete len:391 (+),score=46.13 TRINITY_DN48150_c0_g1_i1:82-1254(+)
MLASAFVVSALQRRALGTAFRYGGRCSLVQRSVVASAPSASTSASDLSRFSGLPRTRRYLRPSFAVPRGCARRFATSSVHKASAHPAGRDESDRLMMDTKVSPGMGTADSLFQECLKEIRNQRAKEQRSSETDLYKDPKQITDLKQDELELTRKIFRRLDPTKDMTSEMEHEGHHIDPYWSPWYHVKSLKDQVFAEFDEYASFVSVAEARRTRIQIKKSLRRAAGIHNPYTPDSAQYHGRPQGSRELPKPFRLSDKYWEPSPLQAQLGKEHITWRDVDILQHFIADNGYILPRRTTMLSRNKQKHMVSAVKHAQRMSLLPYNWKPKGYQAMPLMDPFQWMVDRLTDRVVEARDKRSAAMLKVMMERQPSLNYKRFLQHEARRTERPDKKA